MTEKADFIEASKERGRHFTDVCRDFEIAPKTGYKWLARYAAEGEEGLKERSRAPRTSPQAIEADVARLVTDARTRHPSWGPRKLLAWLKPRHPDVQLPAASTCGELLKRLGFTEERRRRKKIERTSSREAQSTCTGPNAIWSADFKGEFRMRDGTMCYPLTISDGFSRFLIRVEALPATGTALAKPVFEKAFLEFGLPLAIRTDNGAPFATRALHGLSRLAVWWLKLGISLDRIDPGKPQQNGRHERMHRTLKEETASPPKDSFREQQAAFDQFRDEYNRERPHEALDQAPPKTRYEPSPRRYSGRAPEPEYPSVFRVRKVDRNGSIRWRNGEFLYLTQALTGEHVGLEQIDDGTWRVCYAGYQLGLIDERKGTHLVATPLIRWQKPPAVSALRGD